MSLGDLHNNREKLRSELRAIKYSEPIDIKGLNDGEASSTLPIIHFCLLSYSKVFAEYIVDQGFDMMTKNDYSFLESVFKLLRQKFGYRPVLKIGQFLASGFAERKIMMLLDLIQIVKTKTNELQRYQQAEERKSKSPMRSVDEENIKIQTPPRPCVKIYKDPEEILNDYSSILKKKNLEEESQDFNSDSNLKIVIQKLMDDQKKMQNKIEQQDEVIREIKKKYDSQLAQCEARIHLLSSKVKVLEGEKARDEDRDKGGMASRAGADREEKKEREKVERKERSRNEGKVEEGLLSRLRVLGC